MCKYSKEFQAQAYLVINEWRNPLLIPPCNPSNDALLAREEGVPGVPLRLVGVPEFELEVADDERAELVQLDTGDVLAQAGPCAEAKCHHVLVHVARTLMVEPAVRFERGGVLAEDLLVLLDDSRVAADDVAAWDELAAERHSLLGYDPGQC